MTAERGNIYGQKPALRSSVAAKPAISTAALEHRPLQVVINSVRIPQSADSVVYGGFPGKVPTDLVLPYQYNWIIVSFASTVYGESRRIQYSTRLEGLEGEWSGWSPKTERDFPHLQKEEQHLRRAEQTEQKLVRVQNEKLEAEVQHKTAAETEHFQ